MQFTTVRNKEKDYNIYLKSEKLVHSQQEHEKNVSQLFGSGIKLVPSYFEPDKHCCSYLEREKSGSLLFGDQKMQFTTVRSKEKDYDIYLKFPSYLEVGKTGSQPAIWRGDYLLFGEKNVSQLFKGKLHEKKLFGSGKNWFLAISSLTNTVAAIWREKKVDSCYMETKKCSSQLLGARKKIMTSI